MQQLRVDQPGFERPTQGFVMIRVASNRSAPPAGLVKPADSRQSFLPLATHARELRKGFLDTYPPELHYMRGPGPKWPPSTSGPPHIPQGPTAGVLAVMDLLIAGLVHRLQTPTLRHADLEAHLVPLVRAASVARHPV